MVAPAWTMPGPTPKLTCWPAVPSKTAIPILPADGIVMVRLLPPITSRPVVDTLAAVYGEGGTKKSWALCAVPPGVATVSRPEVPSPGTVAPRLVAVAELTTARPRLKVSRLFVGTGSKLLPVTVTDVPAWPTEGVKPVMAGAPELTVTVKGVALVADPAGAVTAMGPVVAPAGTVACSWVGVADFTTAAAPLNVTAFWLGVAPKPVP